MLVVAYLASYAVGAAVSFVILRRTVGGLQGRQLLRFLVRMAIVLAAAGAATWLVEWSLAGLGDRPGPLVALFRGGLSGLAGGDRPARRRPPVADPGGHQRGRHRRGATAEGLRVLRVASGSGTGDAGRSTRGFGAAGGREVDDADIDAGR